MQFVEEAKKADIKVLCQQEYKKRAVRKIHQIQNLKQTREMILLQYKPTFWECGVRSTESNNLIDDDFSVAYSNHFWHNFNQAI